MGNKYAIQVANNVRSPTNSWIGKSVSRNMKKENLHLQSKAVELCGISPHHNVLEIGSGHGIALKHACKHIDTGQKGRVYGIDLSPYMISLSSKHLQDEIDADKLRLYIGSVQNLPFNNDKFDRLYHVDCYYCWPEMEVACAEMYRVLKPKSQLVTVVNTDKLKSPKQRSIYSRFRTDLLSYMCMLEAVGFQEVKVEYHTENGREFQAVSAHVLDKAAISEAELAFNRLERKHWEYYNTLLDIEKGTKT